MPRYFFDVENADLTRDEEGLMLDDPEAVAATAMRTLLDIARFEVIRQNERQMSVTVRDEAGTLLYRTELSIRAGWLIQPR